MNQVRWITLLICIAALLLWLMAPEKEVTIKELSGTWRPPPVATATPAPSPVSGWWAGMPTPVPLPQPSTRSP